ncbi:hypothetical protein MNBD_BACTEROID04-1999 [hydrothermal vent metagenome]|uniref:Methyltransferase type 11 domain-containing protein n=1 Tax=hydrothermal vent metagenome TaxID=652676 RepID=A0A3B0UFC0_9ZZZZ
MNTYLENFIKEKFQTPGKALDLGAGKFQDIEALKKKGWVCEGVDKNRGIDLNELYISKIKPFDLVYSNYVLHFLKNKQQLLDTVYQNLKKDGWLFLQTFDKSDENIKGFTKEEIMNLLKDFQNISTKVFSIYDDEPGHNHWHQIMEVTAQKK